MDLSAIVPFIAVAAGGAIGALIRFCFYKTIDTEFPWATFLVNIIGCCLASFLMFKYGMMMDGAWKTFLFVGLFGAFTTMSTFSIDTVNLMIAGSYAGAVLNIILNCFVCILGALAGHWLANAC